MSVIRNKPKLVMTSLLLSFGLSATALASEPATARDENYDTLKSEINELRDQIAIMQELLKQQGITLQNKAEPEVYKAEIKKLKKDVKKIAKVAKSAEEWKNTNSTVHLAGYASAGFSKQAGESGSFSQAQFSPIFHYQYKDKVLLESEIEFKILEDGSTSVGMEYLTLDLILNDYMALIAGKFISPLGQFRQNIHPSWINKLPSAPAGFGHDQAAPVADTGIQLRGAIPMGDSDIRANYAVYVANGPELILEGAEIEEIATEGVTRDQDGNKVYGGRVGFNPIAKMEIGLSVASGKAAIALENERSYNVLGADFTWQWKKLDLRGEYVQQKVGALASSAAPQSWQWSSWYMQGAYKLPNNFEAVARYSDYDSPHASQDQKQWAIGLNYLFAPQVITKISYEFNDGLAGTSAAANRIRAQIAYGF